MSKNKTKRPRKPDPKGCQHVATVDTWVRDENGDEIAVARHCSSGFGCGERLSLGPSNDGPWPVRIEIRAAELAAISITDARHGLVPFSATTSEGWGWADHADGSDWIGSPPSDMWWSGWLARQIVTHDISSEVGPADFADSAWDEPIRAGAASAVGLTRRELREQTAADIAAEDVLRDPAVTAHNAEVIAEQTRHDIAASVARHAEIEPPTDPATKFGELAQQVTVPVARHTDPGVLLAGEDPSIAEWDQALKDAAQDLLDGVGEPAEDEP